MNLINSVNIQMDSGAEILISFGCRLKTPAQAMEQATDAIHYETKKTITAVRPNPPAHGKNLSTVYAGGTVLGWITLNEEPVKVIPVCVCKGKFHDDACPLRVN